MARTSTKSEHDQTLTFDERELAKRLKVSPKTVYRLRCKGVIPFYRVGVSVRYDETVYATILDRLRRDAA